MAIRYSRAGFLARLRAELAAGRSLLMTGAGAGICAKFIERGGADIIGVYNTGYFRMQGYGSLAGMLPMADANALVYRTGAREVLPQVRETPVVAGVNGVDVTRDLGRFLKQVKHIGFSGVHNFPTVAWFDGEFRETLEGTGLGFQREIDMLRQAHDLDLLTVGYAFRPAETEQVVREADVDIFIFHAGITAGGSTGYARGRSLDDTVARTQENFRVARAIKSDVILLAHGAALVSPADAQHMLDHTDAQGVQLGSSIERLAMEGPLRERTEQFKGVGFGTAGLRRAATLVLPSPPRVGERGEPELPLA
jgi:predicted TIM-barrel enzyme